MYTKPKMTTTIKARNKSHLQKLIQETIRQHGSQADLNFIDVGQITDMSSLFDGSDFNGDISQWRRIQLECI